MISLDITAISILPLTEMFAVLPATAEFLAAFVRVHAGSGMPKSHSCFPALTNVLGSNKTYT
jgi:hypothetical protein